MRAAIYQVNGAPEVLRYQEVADPKCPAGGVVIRIEAISIEGGDTLARWRVPPSQSPYIPGYQAAGEIVEAGPEVSHLRVGQKVVTVGPDGSHAELRCALASDAWAIPDGLDVRQAAAVPIAFGTADACLFEFGRLQAGETVLIQAGAGGVGTAAIQLAKRAGARVLATASSEARLEALAVLGLDHGINSRTDDLVGAVMRLTGGKGADLVVDPVGGPTLQASILALADRGRLTMVGAAGREGMTVDVSTLVSGNRSLMGVFLGAGLRTERGYRNVQRLLDEVAAGHLKAVIDRTFPLSEAASAHAYAESRQAVGRVLVIP